MSDLLGRLQLSGQVVDNCENIDEFLNKEIDYSKVDRIISFERMHTYEYLKGEIKKCTQN